MTPEQWNKEFKKLMRQRSFMCSADKRKEQKEVIQHYDLKIKLGNKSPLTAAWLEEKE